MSNNYTGSVTRQNRLTIRYSITKPGSARQRHAARWQQAANGAMSGSSAVVDETDQDPGRLPAAAVTPRHEPESPEQKYVANDHGSVRNNTSWAREVHNLKRASYEHTDAPPRTDT